MTGLGGLETAARFRYFSAEIRQGRRPVEFPLWAERLTAVEFDQILDAAWEDGVTQGDLTRLALVESLKPRARESIHRGYLDPTLALQALLTLTEGSHGSSERPA